MASEEALLDPALLQAAADGEDFGDDVDIDLSEAINFDPFEADDLPFEVIAAEKKIGKTSKAPYIELTVKAFDHEEFAGRQLYTNVNLTGKGAGIGFDTLEALGATDKAGNLVTRDNPKVNPGRLVGLKGLAKVRIKPAEGEYKAKAEIKRVRPYVSDAVAEASDLK